MSEPFYWLNAESRQFLENDYLPLGQSIEDRIDVICNTAETILKIPGFAKKFKDYLSKGYYSLSTPIWANFGTTRGLPISCYGSDIQDSMASILATQAEVGMMTKYGGGTSAYFGNVRSRGSIIKDNGQSSGSVHFMKLYNDLITIVSQGRLRRGNFAAYLPIDHGDIDEFLTIRSEGSPLQDISFGVCVPDYWLKEMIAGDQDKRKVWAKVLECRVNTGYPYIFFTDNVNNQAPDVYKDNKMIITHGNLCNEICEPDSETESFVCDLASKNVSLYDEWKDTDSVETLVFFLDAVMTEFIEKAEKMPFMEKAVRFAKNHRALGIGWLGWHSYLQSKMIPFESFEAKSKNIEIAKCIKEKTYKASRELFDIFGASDMMTPYKRRNAVLMAIAPTKSSSWILGQISESVQAETTNFCIRDLQKGKFSFKNPYLQKLLKDKDCDTEVIWKNILLHGGSVQHLDFLSEHEKNVFKTFAEISPMEIVIQASQRQKYIDQGQSLNLMIHPSTPIKDLNTLILEGWRLGIKGFYYQISINAAQQFTRNILSCSSCEA